VTRVTTTLFCWMGCLACATPARAWLVDGRPPSLDAVRARIAAGDRHAARHLAEVALPAYPDAERHDASFLLAGLEVPPQAAVDLLTRLPVPFGLVEDRRLVRLARAQAAAGHARDALETLALLLEAWPDVPEKDALGLLTAELLAKGKDPGPARKAYDAVWQDPQAPRVLRARALAARAALATDAAERRKLHRRLLMDFPAEPVARAPLGIKVADLTPKERFQRAERLMDHWAYAEAREEFRRFLDHPKLGKRARWQVGIIGLEKLRDGHQEARKMFESLLKLGIEDEDGAQYRLFRAVLAGDDHQTAMRLARAYQKRFGKGAFAEPVAYYVAWLPFDKGDCKTAVPAFQWYARRFGERRAVAQGLAAWCQLREERWKDAIEAFERLIPNGNPLVRGKAWYWQAVAHQRLGEPEATRSKLAALHAEYPLSYYDVLGQQLLARIEGRDPRASRLPWPEAGGNAQLAHTHPKDPWSLPQLKGPSLERFERVHRLVELGEIDEARRSYLGLRDRVEAGVPEKWRLPFIRFMGDALLDYQHGWELVTGGSISAMSGMPDPQALEWLLAYPRAYAHLVEPLSRAHRVPSAFAYAIMRQESRYQPSEISHTDAVGALQMIPETAKKVAAEMGVPYDPVSFPRPEVGFPFSFFYFKKHLELWRGQLVLTAASYNAGPEPMARWLRENRGADLARLVEQISYSEARNYCRKVAEHTLRYLYLYEPDPKVRGAVLDALFPLEVNAEVPEDLGY
jgi:soluble lytic murein transglycosylase-like protein